MCVCVCVHIYKYIIHVTCCNVVLTGLNGCPCGGGCGLLSSTSLTFAGTVCVCVCVCVFVHVWMNL